MNTSLNLPPIRQGIAVYYRQEMTPQGYKGQISQSPFKPILIAEGTACLADLIPVPVESIDPYPVQGCRDLPGFEIRDTFSPIAIERLLRVHTPEYVQAFQTGEPARLASRSCMPWSESYRDSVLWSVGGLAAAVHAAIDNPRVITCCASGFFHHSTPEGGQQFCPVSGGVLIVLDIWEKRGLAAIVGDIDKHNGNSADASRSFCPELDSALPDSSHVNLHAGNSKTEAQWLQNFKERLQACEEDLLARKVHYVIFGIGADSHEADDFVGLCTTEGWLECSRYFFNWVRRMDGLLGKPLPVTIVFHGGYRMDSPRTVIALLMANLLMGSRMLCGGQEFDLVSNRAGQETVFPSEWICGNEPLTTGRTFVPLPD